MSTNNNRLGKEIQPIWKTNNKQKITKVSGIKIQRLINNSIEDLTALSLKDCDVNKIEDFNGFIKLQRLDLSENKLKRLNGMSDLVNLGMLNISKNLLDGGGSCEELRYLTELRTLNIGENPKIKHIETHTIKPLNKLQALIANDCGLSKASFIKFCPLLNTLILSKNKLTYFVNNSTINTTFIHLTKLSLGYNELTQIPNLSICPNLTELRLNNNQILSITSDILITSKLKILDLSNNLISSWNDVEILTNLSQLTNLSIKGNRLPLPPNTFDNTPLREDYYTSNHQTTLSDEEKKYRHHILSLFQIRVGTEQKLKVRLIVLDMKRVKMKWSHNLEVKENNTKLITSIETEPESFQNNHEIIKPSKKEKKEKKEKRKNNETINSNNSSESNLEFKSDNNNNINNDKDDEDEKDLIDLIPTNQSNDTNEPNQLTSQKNKKLNQKKEKKENTPSTHVTGVVEVKIIKKRGNETLSSQKQENNNKKKLKKESKQDDNQNHIFKLSKENNPLALLSEPVISNIGVGGSSQWD